MIGETETALLERVRALFGATLRQVDTHPGTWSDNGKVGVSPSGSTYAGSIPASTLIHFSFQYFYFSTRNI
ncbi:hypothetical protein AH97_19505 [Salmonella enterica subsp. enterica]|nr:hypothetical protein [Salmonella enterica subsp. enterica serovar Hartford]